MQYRKIQEKFNKIISYSQEIKNPQTDDLFNRWMEAKRDFIEAMDGKLIYEMPEKVSFELGPKEKSFRVNDFITMIENKWQNIDLADFIHYQKEGFFSNQVVKDYSFGNITIKKGMKLLKAFKYFEDDVKVLNDLQSAASMIIQEDKVEGTLCFSVHPLDFLSISENNHNWRSCHALNGEYRSGNLSYMVDKTTAICYLKSKQEEVLPDFPEDVKWNSKKWRVLLYFSENWDMIFAGRQYPFKTETGIDFVKNEFLPKAIRSGTNWSPWFQKKIREIDDAGFEIALKSSYIPTPEGELMPLGQLIINESGSLQFNDLLSSSCYDPVYSFKIDDYASRWKRIMPTTWKKYDRKPFRIGGKVKCLRCDNKFIELSETMMCTECELLYGNSESDTFGYCNCCGNRFIYDDGIWVDQTEEMICPSCADYHTDFCANCGERYYTEDMIYEKKSQDFLCRWCFEDIVDVEEL